MAAPELAVVGDIGGTNMRIGVATAQGLIEQEIVPTPHDPDQFFNVLGGLMLNYVQSRGAKLGAVGFPGPVKVSKEGITAGPFENIAGLNEAFDINERLAAEHKELSGFGVLTLNDGEASTHAAPHLLEDTDVEDRVITYFTHSTGVGGDSIKDGVVCSRADGMLAEYGHIPVRLSNDSYSTLEKRISGNAIHQLYGKGRHSAEVVYSWEGAQSVWDLIGRDFGQGIGFFAPVVGMTDVVIGGGVSVCHPRYDRALREELAKAVAPMPAHIVNTPPNITYVPTDQIPTLGMRGAFFALQERYEEVA